MSFGQIIPVVQRKHVCPYHETRLVVFVHFVGSSARTKGIARTLVAATKSDMARTICITIIQREFREELRTLSFDRGQYSYHVLEILYSAYLEQATTS